MSSVLLDRVAVLAETSNQIAPSLDDVDAFEEWLESLGDYERELYDDVMSEIEELTVGSCPGP